MDLIVRPMSDEQRKSIALEYLLRLDRGEDVIDLFDANACAHFPKWGVARGKEQIHQLFGDLGQIIKSITHHHAYLNVMVKDDHDRRDRVEGRSDPCRLVVRCVRDP